ncbi:MAG: nucleotidyltransferase domain-containing protein [Candidatus Omnitrophica bacterium]|nr:nucleotidyltransferase domain-containing protein [Candidatus Omnitrophota bacterium]
MELTKSEQIILKYLASHTGETLYESEIAKNTQISVGSTNQSLKELLKKEMVSLAKKGNMNFYSLNLDNPLAKQFKITETVTELNGLIGKLKPLTKRIILFGSCAEGVDTQNSDIDLAIVSQEEQAVRKIVKKEKITREIQALIFKLNDFLALSEKGKPLYERIQKGIVLWRVD